MSFRAHRGEYMGSGAWPGGVWGESLEGGPAPWTRRCAAFRPEIIWFPPPQSSPGGGGGQTGRRKSLSLPGKVRKGGPVRPQESPLALLPCPRVRRRSRISGLGTHGGRAKRHGPRRRRRRVVRRRPLSPATARRSRSPRCTARWALGDGSEARSVLFALDAARGGAPRRWGSGATPERTETWFDAPSIKHPRSAASALAPGVRSPQRGETQNSLFTGKVRKGACLGSPWRCFSSRDYVVPPSSILPPWGRRPDRAGRDLSFSANLHPPVTSPGCSGRRRRGTIRVVRRSWCG